MFVVVTGVEKKRQPNLAAVVDAVRGHGLFFAFGQSRQQKRRENRNDSNDYQQLDQSEPCPPKPHWYVATAHTDIAATTLDSELLFLKMH